MATVRERLWIYRRQILDNLIGRGEHAALLLKSQLLRQDPLPSVHRRSNIPALLRYLRLDGLGAELGVFKAEYSRIILMGSNLRRLYSIDRWAGDRGHDIAQMEEARRKLATFGDRSVLMQAAFEEALEHFDDSSLDFVYVDGYAHNGNEDGRTFQLWWPKVRAGGIMAGHDYHSHFERNKRAVDSFAKSNRLTIYITAKDRYPSWIALKG